MTVQSEQQKKVRDRFLHRCHLTKDRLLSDPYFQTGRTPGGVRRERPRKYRPMERRQYRRLSIDEKRRIVFLRYGSLSAFGQPVRDQAEIGRMSRTPRTTIVHLLRKFVNSGHNLAVFEPTSTVFSCIPRNLQGFLRDKRSLQVWAPYSIKERCQIIWKTFQVRLSSNLLRRFYIHHGITYQTCKQVYRSYLTNQPHLDP